jgi:hypothetical protein
MKEDLTLIVAVIDASGSMKDIKAGVIDGFNEFMNAQKEVPGEVIFSMIQFDSGWDSTTWGSHVDNLRYKEIYDFRNLKEVASLTNENYQPNGGTPLIAAMDMAIDSIGAKLTAIPEKDRPSKVVFVTITDGKENSSDKNKYSKTQLAHKTKHQQEKYNWKFIYLGANQDSFSEAGGIGFMAKATANYVYNYAGTKNAIMTASASISNYRIGSSVDIDLTDLITGTEKSGK